MEKRNTDPLIFEKLIFWSANPPQNTALFTDDFRETNKNRVLHGLDDNMYPDNSNLETTSGGGV